MLQDCSATIPAGSIELAATDTQGFEARPREETMDLDIAVVGAGVSGAYCAWRLQQQLGAGARIALFEYSDRIGGRLYTVTLPGLPHVKAEVGGMRYIPSQHIMVANLVDHLKLHKKDFPMGAPAPVGSNCN